VSWRLYPGWGFEPGAFEALLGRLPKDWRSGTLVWSAGSLRFWDDLEAGRARGPVVLVAPVVRYLQGPNFAEGVELRALAALRRRIARDPDRGFDWFTRQVFEAEPPIRTTAWPRDALLAGLDELAERDDRDRVRRLADRVDGVVIACEGDRIVPAGQSRYVAELLGLSYVELPGVSHAPFIERVDDVIGEIASILAR